MWIERDDEKETKTGMINKYCWTPTVNVCKKMTIRILGWIVFGVYTLVW